MADKNIKGRVIHKNGTTSEWALATSFIPYKGEIVLYTDVNKIKIGDGVNVVNDLPFIEGGKIDGVKISDVQLAISSDKVVNLSDTSLDTKYQVATKADINTLQTNFTAGVNSIYDKIVSEGTTPSSKNLSDVVTGIGTLSTDRYNDGKTDYNPTDATLTDAGVLSVTNAAGTERYTETFTNNYNKGVSDTKGTPVVASITGTASSGASTAAISNVNSMKTIDSPSGTAGTDYYEVKATATGTAGSYTPNYTVTTAGWQSSTVNGTAQTVGVTNDTTGKSIYVKAGTEGTPVTTKSAVTNNTITITPSVTNTTGYIKGNNITGTAATVSASDLVSGNKEFIPNVSAQSDVDITNYATVTIKSAITEVSTVADMEAFKADPDNDGRLFKYTGETTDDYVNGRIYIAEYVPPDYLCLTANTAGSTITLNKKGSPNWSGSYSTDKTTWTSYTPGTTGVITLTNAGDKIYFKGTQNADFSSSNYLYFSMSGSVAASGNCMSIWCGDDFETATTIPYKYSGNALFWECKVLTTSPKLPAINLTEGCYRYMFLTCTSLTTVPKLPATTVYTDCYYGTFSGCTSLYVSDTSGEGYDKAWTIPSNGVFDNAIDQELTFYQCKGTRKNQALYPVAGSQFTYYTQNEPV